MAEKEEEEPFKFVDKRKRGEEEEEPEEKKSTVHGPQSTEERKSTVHSPQSTEEEPKEEEKKEEKEEKIPEGKEVDTLSLLKICISILSGGAWSWLGLTAHPQTGKIKRDLQQAKLAIDSISLLLNQIEDKLNELERKEIKALLADLQINYVNQSKIVG